MPASLPLIGRVLPCAFRCPRSFSPVLAVAKAWYYSGLSCEARTALTLYVMPVLGDAVQFIIIDQIQKFRQAPGPEDQGTPLVQLRRGAV